jgi:hypothetical protein
VCALLRHRTAQHARLHERDTRYSAYADVAGGELGAKYQTLQSDNFFLLLGTLCISQQLLVTRYSVTTVCYCTFLPLQDVC